MLIRARSLRAAGRRRAGLFWGRQWAQADLDDQAIEALMGDPVIEVELLDKPDPVAKSVHEIQPRPEQPKAPVMFTDPGQRARQEQLLKERDEKEAAAKTKQRGAKLPPSPKDDLPEPKTSELVVKVEPKTETKPKAEQPKAQTQPTAGPKRS